MSEIIALRGVSAGYDVPILQNVSFSVKKGGLLGILGPNGAGKTTLLKVILGLLVPTTGQVKVLGRTIRTNGDRLWLRRQLGYIPQIQSPGQMPISVEDAVLLGRWGRFFAGLNRPRVEDYGKVREALELVGMAGHERKDWRTLSGGQRQRVALARALVREPELLLLDEPTTYLDPAAQEDLVQLVQRLHSELGLTAVVVTHLVHHDWRFSEVWEMIQGTLRRCAS